MLKDFKAFIMRGNVMDLAIAVIMGAAFGAIVNSLVADILMPPIGLVLGQINFSDMFISLNGQAYGSLAAAQEVGAPTLNYGVFIQTLINFAFISVAVFILVRALSQLQRPQAVPVEPTEKDCPYCLSTIPIKATRCPHCTSELQLD